MNKKYKYQLEAYIDAIKRGRKQKHKCPNCHHNTFVRYVDADGNYVGYDIGRCDREIKCGYHKKPAGSVNIVVSRDIVSNNKDILYIEEELMRASIKKVKNTVLYSYLSSIFNEDIVESVFYEYCVGGSKDNDIVWWQVDVMGRVRTGKIMKYNENGKRYKDNDGKSHIRWVHNYIEYDKDKYDFKQCYFGEHLILSSKYNKLCIVESEKTAVICAMFDLYTGNKDTIYVATGGKNLLKPTTLSYYQDFFDLDDIFILPDADAISDWYKILQGTNFVSRVVIWPKLYNEVGICEDWDIGDVIINIEMKKINEKEKIIEYEGKEQKKD